MVEVGVMMDEIIEVIVWSMGWCSRHNIHASLQCAQLGLGGEKKREGRLLGKVENVHKFQRKSMENVGYQERNRTKFKKFPTSLPLPPS
jgi:hypothetical protein